MEHRTITFMLKWILGFAVLLIGYWHWTTVKSDMVLILFQLVGFGIMAYSLLDLSTAGGWKT